MDGWVYRAGERLFTLREPGRIRSVVRFKSGTWAWFVLLPDWRVEACGTAATWEASMVASFNAKPLPADVRVSEPEYLRLTG